MSHLVYPRLPFSAAEHRVREIAELIEGHGISEVKQLVALEHPRAAPVATGGRVVGVNHLQTVRELTIKRLEPWLSKGELGRYQASDFDAALGVALHETLSIVPADAAHAETWNFLSLVVFPDVAVARFPGLHRDRLMGTSRNALRRAWVRQEVLGELMQSEVRPLGEDELVGLFERTALARNRRLLRRLARAVLDYDGDEGRSAWARELYKRVTFATGPRLLDALTDDDLDDLIHGREPGSRIHPAEHGYEPPTARPPSTAPPPGRGWLREKLSELWSRDEQGERAEELRQPVPSPVLGEAPITPKEHSEAETDSTHHLVQAADDAATPKGIDGRGHEGRRDVGAHIAAVFESLPEGTFLSVNEIVHRASPQYEAGEISGGAVLYRLRTERPIPGVEPVLDASPLGARAVAGVAPAGQGIRAPNVPSPNRSASEAAAAVSQPDLTSLALLFHREMAKAYERAKRELGYNASYLLRMLAQDGGVRTATRLVMAEHPSEGFSYLWEHQRLDLAAECLVLRPDFRALFTEEVIRRAEQRLHDHGFSV